VSKRLRRWIADGHDALGALDQVVAGVAATARETEALRESVADLRTENERLCAENAALRARAAATSRGLAELAERIVRPLGEIVHRLRAP
jgi:regulator of replication initiation timing